MSNALKGACIIGQSGGPSAVINASAYGVIKTALENEDLQALKNGLPNLLRHVKNITQVFGLPAVVAINRFPADTPAELELIRRELEQLGVEAVLSEVWAKGGQGGMELARRVAQLCRQPNRFRFCYEDQDGLEDKLDKLATRVYGGRGVVLAAAARKKLESFQKQGLDKLPICMAKTQYSFSDDAALLGAPQDFRITVRDLRLCAGAGFIVALAGDIMTMPGLPKRPAAENIDVDENGRITGLF